MKQKYKYCKEKNINQRVFPKSKLIADLHSHDIGILSRE